MHQHDGNGLEWICHLWTSGETFGMFSLQCIGPEQFIYQWYSIVFNTYIKDLFTSDILGVFHQQEKKDAVFLR